MLRVLPLEKIHYAAIIITCISTELTTSFSENMVKEIFHFFMPVYCDHWRAGIACANVLNADYALLLNFLFENL